MSIRYPLVRKRSASSTRRGVRTRPLRLGSSPSRSSTSSISGAIGFASTFGLITFTTALFDFIGSNFKDVPRRLSDAHFFQLRPLARKHLPPIPLEPPANLATQ